MLHPNHDQVVMEDFFRLHAVNEEEILSKFLPFYQIDKMGRRWLGGKCHDAKMQSLNLLTPPTSPMNLLTPPTSPQHDSFSDTPSLCADDFLRDVIQQGQDYLDLDSTRSLLPNILPNIESETDEKDTLNSNLIQDCMWSGPGLTTSLLGKRRHSVDENCNTIVNKKAHMDMIDITDCVDPTIVFPDCLRNTSPIPRLSISLAPVDDYSGLETPSASESDDEEIDVVGVTDKNARYKHSSSALSNFNETRPTIKVVNNGLKTIISTNLPATTSISAHLSNLHNYSSTTPSVKSHSCLKSSLSAPHTPSNHAHSIKHSRAFSSPTSPLFSTKKQKPLSAKHRIINSERDLQAVVHGLNSCARKPKCNDAHNYSRAGSDNEEMNETGKRTYHNKLERRRRDDLRHSQEMLRVQVPVLLDNERAPKLTILNEATEHVLELTHKHQSLNAAFQRQKAINEHLRKKLSQLHRDQF